MKSFIGYVNPPKLLLIVSKVRTVNRMRDSTLAFKDSFASIGKKITLVAIKMWFYIGILVDFLLEFFPLCLIFFLVQWRFALVVLFVAILLI